MHCQRRAGYICSIRLVCSSAGVGAMLEVMLERMTVWNLKYALASDKILYEDHYFTPTALSRVQYDPRASPRAILVTLDNASV